MDTTYEKSATEGEVIITTTRPPIVETVNIGELKDKIISLQAQIAEITQKYVDQAEWKIARRNEAILEANALTANLQAQIAELQKIIDGAVAVGVKEVIAEAPVEEVII